jgi:hypothetical protein
MIHRDVLIAEQLRSSSQDPTTEAVDTEDKNVRCSQQFAQSVELTPLFLSSQAATSLFSAKIVINPADNYFSRNNYTRTGSLQLNGAGFFIV